MKNHRENFHTNMKPAILSKYYLESNARSLLDSLGAPSFSKGFSISKNKAVKIRQNLKRELVLAKRISDLRYADLEEATKDCKIYGEYSDGMEYIAVKSNCHDKYMLAMEFETQLSDLIGKLKHFINESFDNYISVKKEKS